METTQGYLVNMYNDCETKKRRILFYLHITEICYIIQKLYLYYSIFYYDLHAKIGIKNYPKPIKNLSKNITYISSKNIYKLKFYF